MKSLWNKIKELIRQMLSGKTVEQALQVTPIISDKMSDAIELWTNMYEGNAPWLHEPSYQDATKVVSLGLPSFIASEKARMAVLEMKSEITTPMEQKTVDDIQVDEPIGDTTRADYMQSQYEKLLSKIRNQLEYGIAKGGLIIKPYIVKEPYKDENGKEYPARIEFDYIHADGFFPLAFDGSGKVTEAAFIQTKTDKDTIYRRLEHHKLEGNSVLISNKAYKAKANATNGNSDIDIGTEVSLQSIPEWADIQPEAIIQNVDRLLFAYFKMPEANTVDTHSPLGVSGFSRAVKLIKEADLQYSRMLWEFEGGEMAIDVDRTALGMDEEETQLSMNHLQRRLYRKLDLNDEDTYNVFAPALRDDSFINGLNNILMRIEDVCALSRGTLSDVAAEARTATELKILKQRSYSANEEIQKELERTLKDVVYIMNAYCTLYGITQEGEYEVSFEWDDSILVDVNEELNKRIQLMQNGLISKTDLRMWYFGETEAQAKEKLAQIDEEIMQTVDMGE